MARPQRHDPIDRSDPLWFKDAVIYELHIKAFFDGNDDGVGDFAGLLQKLDYLRSLGVTALWLLPFYPSPLRDDGYDIAEYRSINPSYGTMREFRQFVQACHERGLRVITELVVNHTSDTHPWFQRARLSKPDSSYRNYYVWSDDDKKYTETRIIFIDTEKSNWTLDPVAQKYYWHRFYSHQPDLNFDNPRVVKEVLSVMNYWLAMGVDGLRLDAVPYLCEREGTINENLPETHAVLQRLRAGIDASFPDRMLLAEANQWPEDVLPYFGTGDECHMAFHFPLMPRMYMAIAQEDRHPITDIMRQTPDIPDNCQWAIFLRNHDELTLEMVTSRERDYLWSHYATDPRMRLNLGIRRRLAPLMDNDRRKIELMNGLLLSLPGTPVIYYGDEIGMGDNVYLGDRDGVRTPMQWSPDRNGGFSRADPARLYYPPIMDAIYGYGAVNVEAQTRNPSSLLNWTRRILAVRQGEKAFGRGSLVFLYPGNRKILAFLRSHEGRTVLCVFNLSRAAQAVELDLSRYRGRIPVEMMGRSAFPPIGDLPYLLTLTAYGFYWFLLADEDQLPSWHDTIPDPAPEFVTLVIRQGWQDIWKEPTRRLLETVALPGFLARQRWFGAKDAEIAGAKLTNALEFSADGTSFLFSGVDVELAGAENQRYFLPLALAGETEVSGGPLISFIIAQVRHGPRLQALYDAMVSQEFPRAVLDAMRKDKVLDAERGAVHFWSTGELASLELPSDIEIRRLGAEQSNSSVLFGDQAVLKLYRRLVGGVHPEVEMCRFLTEAGYRNTPPLLGAVEFRDPERDETVALAIAQGFVRNQGNGWDHALGYLQQILEAKGLGGTPPSPEAEPGVAPEATHEVFIERYATLGRRIAEMHRILAGTTGDPAFDPEPVTAADLRAWREGARREVEQGFSALRNMQRSLPEGLQAEVEALFERRKDCLDFVNAATARRVRAMKTRIHGDMHLGQVLVTQNDWHVIDFEGEPARPMAARRVKQSPLRDVAGMLRSFDYAARAATMTAATPVGTPIEQIEAPALAWRDAAIEAFTTAYRATAQGMASFPEDPAEARRLRDLFMIEKACYEMRYEAANRPDWIGIPVRGVRAILEGQEARP